MIEKREQLFIEMDHMEFTSNKKIDLITLGVCTCIAFVIQGVYEEENSEKQVPFCGLFHWSGFEPSSPDHHDQTKQVFKNFLNNLRINLALEANQLVKINKLLFIGGEKAEYNERQEVTLTGTEAEVNALKQVINTFNFKQRYFLVNPNNIEQQYYLTQGNESIDICVNVTHYEHFINDGIDDSLDNINQVTVLTYK